MQKKEVPVFVKIDEYKDILDVITLAREKLEVAKNSLAKLKELNSKRAQELVSWEQELKNAGSKLEEVDSTLLEPGM